MQIEEIYQIYKRHPKVVIDNRKVEQDSIFIGIKGEKFDGSAFAKAALDAGAAYAIIDNPAYQLDERTILVKDSVIALQELATLHRKSFSIPFIAIAGSNGKTTTKELVQSVLSTTYKSFATKGNLNNHLGVPLTLLSIGADAEMVIIEIGANHLQETYDLCRIAQPDYGIVTNNGKDHLEGFGSIENVIKANGELFKWLSETGGKAFVNMNHTDLKNASDTVERITYGSSGDVYMTFESILDDSNAAIMIDQDKTKISSHLFGHFNADNLAAATVIGKYFKVPLSNIQKAIGDYVPAMNRSQIKEQAGITFYVDCYNANPSSMKLALDSFAHSAPSPKAVILADMLELGDHSLKEHGDIIAQLKQIQLDKIILVGKMFGEFSNRIEASHYPSTQELLEDFNPAEFDGWSILLKGSRGYTLEKVLELH